MAETVSIRLADGLASDTEQGLMSAAQASKLAGVEALATANRSDSATDTAISTAVATEATARTTADAALDGRVDALELAPPAHTHDDRYYTETEIDTALALKATAASVTTEASTRAGADTALDGRLDTIEADYATQTALTTGLAGKETAGAASTAQAYAIQRANHTGTQSADTLTDGTTNKAYTATEKTKLSGIATAATANDTDANLKARANHTGTQTASTISDFSTAADARITAATIAASQLSGTIAQARLGTGSSGAGTKFLADDQTYKTVSSGSGDLLSTNNLSDLANAGTARTNLGLGTIATQAASSVAITGGSITGITDLAVADGGTGASTAAAARTNLGLVIGTDIPRGELGYVQVTSNQSTSSATPVDVTSLSLTVTATSRALKITFYCATVRSNADQRRIFLFIYDVTGSATVQQGTITENGANSGFSLTMIARVSPGAGSRTYKAQVQAADSGTATLLASSTAPMFLMIEEV